MTKDTQAKPKRTRADWQAIERSHATGRYSDGELATLHKVARETIVRRRAADQLKDPGAWAKDLTEKVRVATQAILHHKQVTANVTSTITEGHKSSAVMVAAEMGAKVILAHRAELLRARGVAASMLEELAESKMLDDERELLAEIVAGDGADADKVARVRAGMQKAFGLASRVSSVKALAETLTKLHVGERAAFNMDDPAPTEGGQSNLSDAERASRLATLLARARAAADAADS